MQSGHLVVRDFAQIREASIEFRDLTVLVGAQGTGKSLVLQWLKAAIDGKYIVKTLREAGQEFSRKTLVDQIFGAGMRSAWRDTTQVSFDGKAVSPATIKKRGGGVEKLFFIPAHRSMLISDGWAIPFQKLTAETPVVARLFSQNLFERFNAREGAKLFPLDRLLKKVYRELVNDAVFHGGTIGVEQNEQLTKRLRLRYFEGRQETSLPFMTWTAGQREFTPLLLGLYHLLPPRQKKKDDDIDWVVIEEPEMGLHPQAVTVVMLLVLDLLWRGYRVVLSTHSPIVVTAVWALQRLAATHASYQLVCDAFSVPIKDRPSLRPVAEAALGKLFATYVLSYDRDNQVTARDISSLDPGDDDDAVSGWGGLAGFSSRFAESVRDAVNGAPGGDAS